VEPPQNGERRVLVKKEAQLPIVYLGYHVPNQQSADAPALELLSTILSSGRASRLYRGLVYERQLALEAGGDAQVRGNVESLMRVVEALERAGVELMLGLAAHHVAVVERLHGARRELRVRQRIHRRRGEELPRGAIVLAELRHADTDDGDSSHGVMIAKRPGRRGGRGQRRDDADRRSRFCAWHRLSSRSNARRLATVMGRGRSSCVQPAAPFTSARRRPPATRFA